MSAGKYKKFDLEAWIPSRNGYGETEFLIYDRIQCLDADDEWAGARFEPDLVPRGWRIARKGICLGRSSTPGHEYQRVRVMEMRC
jgi:hypothetical protein